MKVVAPLIIDESKLTSSSIPEPDIARGEVEWVAYTAAFGDQRVVLSNHSKYQCIVDAGTTDDPVTGAAKNVPTWLRIGSTNRYSMFDESNGTQSLATNTMTVRLNAGENIDSIALFNLTGSYQVQIIMNDPVQGEVYNKTIETVDNSQVISAWTYFFSPIVFIDKFVELDLPPYPNAYTEIIISGTGEIGLGSFVVGRASELYTTIYGTAVNLINRSLVEDDGYGNYNVVKRPSSTRLTYEVRFPTEFVNTILTRLQPLIDRSAVWIAEEEDQYRYALNYGFYKDSDIFPAGPNISELRIEVEGIA